MMGTQIFNSKPSWLYALIAILIIAVMVLAYWNYLLSQKIERSFLLIENTALHQQLAQMEQNQELYRLNRSQQQLKEQIVAQDNP